MSRVFVCAEWNFAPFVHPNIGSKQQAASAISGTSTNRHLSLSCDSFVCLSAPGFPPGDTLYAWSKESIELLRQIAGGATGQQVDVIIDVVWQAHTPVPPMPPNQWATAPYGNAWCYRYGGANLLNVYPGTAFWTPGSSHHAFTFNVAIGADDLFIVQLTSQRSLPMVWDVSTVITPLP
jgi:hypothetical protein